MFISNCQEIFTPREYVCRDESMILYNYRLSFRWYNLSKRNRYSIKIYTLDSSGYVWNAKVLGGSDSSSKIQNLDYSGSILIDLGQYFLNSGISCAENCRLYCSFKLATYFSHNTEYCGTLKKSINKNMKI